MKLDKSNPIVIQWELREGGSSLEAKGRKTAQVWARIFSLAALISSFQFPTSVSAQQPLDTYLQEASENNPALRGQYAEFEASLERVAQVNSLPNPTLSFGYFIQPVETRVGPQRARFSLSQMFHWFGSLSAKGDAAAARAQANYLRFIDAREKLRSEVKTSYYELWEIDEQLKLERENLRILETYEELSTTRVRSGNGRFSDVYRVQMQIEESRTRIRILEDQKAPLQRSFNRLLNRNADETVEIADTIVAPENTINLDPQGNHPAIAQHREMRQAAQHQATAAQKSGLPGFGLGLDYVIVDERSDMALPDNGKDAIMPMLSLSLPIWRKQYKAARQEAELQQEQYELQTEASSNSLSSDIDLTAFRLREAQEEMQLYEREIGIARKTLELVITDYTNDREDFEEVLRLQQKIIQFQRLRLKAYKQYLGKYADLEYLTYQFEEDEQE